MTWKRASWIGVGLLLLLMAAICTFLGQKVRESESQNTVLVTKQAALSTEVALLRKQLAEAQAGVSQTIPAPKAPEAQKKVPETTGWSQWRSFAPFRHKMMLRNFWYRYHEAIAKLNLAPDQQAHLLDLMVSKNETYMDAADASNAQGLTDQKFVQAASKQAIDEINSEIAEMLGPDGLADLNHAQDLRYQQDFIKANVGADFQMGGVPLTSDQEVGMAQVMLDVSKKFGIPNQNFFLMGIPADASSLPDADTAVQQAASQILSPQQMTVLNAYLQWNDQRIKVAISAPK
jgi:hypothetical protein